MKTVGQAVIGQSMDKCGRAQKERVGRSKAAARRGEGTAVLRVRFTFESDRGRKISEKGER